MVLALVQLQESGGPQLTAPAQELQQMYSSSAGHQEEVYSSTALHTVVQALQLVLYSSSTALLQLHNFTAQDLSKALQLYRGASALSL